MNQIFTLGQTQFPAQASCVFGNAWQCDAGGPVSLAIPADGSGAGVSLAGRASFVQRLRRSPQRASAQGGQSPAGLDHLTLTHGSLFHHAGGADPGLVVQDQGRLGRPRDVHVAHETVPASGRGPEIQDRPAPGYHGPRLGVLQRAELIVGKLAQRGNVNGKKKAPSSGVLPAFLCRGFASPCLIAFVAV